MPYDGENLLPAKILRPRPHLAARACERQLADGDGMRLRLMRIRRLASEALHQRGLPRSPAANEEELQLKQRATLLVARLEIVAEDFFGRPAQYAVGQTQCRVEIQPQSRSSRS